MQPLVPPFGSAAVSKDELLAGIKQGGLPPLETRSFTGHKLRHATQSERADPQRSQLALLHWPLLDADR